MKLAKVILLVLGFFAIMGGITAFKTKRIPVVFFSVNTTTANPAHRLCTVPFVTAYTTVEADKIPGAPTIIQSCWHTTAISSTCCPTITIWPAE